jgi:hypothetical protein
MGVYCHCPSRNIILRYFVSAVPYVKTQDFAGYISGPTFKCVNSVKVKNITFPRLCLGKQKIFPVFQMFPVQHYPPVTYSTGITVSGLLSKFCDKQKESKILEKKSVG